MDRSSGSGASIRVNRVNHFWNSGRQDELEIRENDIYMVEFYLHAYSLVKREGKLSCIESKEGYSYV